MIDTSVLIECERALAESGTGWRQLLPDESMITAVSVFELRLGILLGSPGQRTRARSQFFDDARATLHVLPFDAAAAEIMADLHVRLRSAGTPIGERDLQIASIALAGRHEVMTLNVSEFARVNELSLRAFPGG